MTSLLGLILAPCKMYIAITAPGQRHPQDRDAMPFTHNNIVSWSNDREGRWNMIMMKKVKSQERGIRRKREEIQTKLTRRWGQTTFKSLTVERGG